MIDEYPIAVMSFNRPKYLEPVLKSLAAQADCRMSQRPIALFQDGTASRVSGKVHANQHDIDACVDLFTCYFPQGTIFKSDINLGVALNFERAENYVFNTLGGGRYLLRRRSGGLALYVSSLERLLKLAETDERIGYVAVYGHHRTPLDVQKENPAQFVLLEHNWGFGRSKRQWLRNKPYVDEYLALVRKYDYRARDANRVHQLFASWGLGCPGDSQDVAKTLACCLTGAVKLNTQACLGKYIGAAGLHMKPGWYDRLGYEATEMFQDAITHFEPMALATYSKILGIQMQWATEKPCRCQGISAGGRGNGPNDTPPLARAEGGSAEIPLRMSPGEADLFARKLKTTTHYLEWGAGGSTLAAVRWAAEKIVSIETDPLWIGRLHQHDEIRSAMTENRLILRHIDVGAVGQWDVPKGDEKIRNWPRYALEPFVLTDFNFDLILIDGRFRIHCLLPAASCAAPETEIFLHDYQFRHGYTIADKYFDTVERVDSSVILKIRKIINRRSLYIDLVNGLFQV